MKILVVSLLRLGDIIQQEPLLLGLRQKYPHSELHLLVNQQFSGVEKILRGSVDHLKYFDRDALQRGLGEAGFNILWSFGQLEKCLYELNKEQYDQVYNFTHTKLSAYLIAAIKAPEKIGLYYFERKFLGLENPWLNYFNDRFPGKEKSLFQYNELLANSFAIPLSKNPLLLDFQQSQKKSIKSHKGLILFQCLTSDDKKNWGIEKFKNLKQTIFDCLGDFKVRILGAPFEMDRLETVFCREDLIICDLAEAQNYLRQADLLVTGDTSIKHMAARMGTPLVEICIGSSDSTKTAAFSNQSQIIDSNVACYPCNHSQKCSQTAHLCADEISVEQVFAAVWDQLSGEKQKRKWQLRDFERFVWTVYLNHELIGDDQETKVSIAKAALDFVRQFSELKELLTVLKAQGLQYKSWLEEAKRSLPERSTILNKNSLQVSDINETILVGQEIIRSKKDEFGYFKGFLESLVARFSRPVQLYDQISRELKKLSIILNIREELVQQIELISRIETQEGIFYAAETRNLSVGNLRESVTEDRANL